MRFDARRQGLAALLAIGIAILCGVVAGLLGRGHYDGRYALPVPGSEPRRAAAPPPVPRIVVPPAPPPAAAPAPPPVEDTPDADDQDGARIAAAIARATRKALDRGEPVRWHKAGESGYIVVSDAQDYPDRTCRNVFATLVRDDGETRSAPHLWCIAAGDEAWEAVR